MRSKRVVASLIVILFAMIVVFESEQVTAIVPSDINVGPYVENLEYKIIQSADQRVLAIQAGVIEMDTSSFSPVVYPIIDADPNIEISSILHDGYGQITINCRDYPLNITALRRAFAYAFDKVRVQSDIFSGLSRVHDSLVPYANSLFCIEDAMSYHYYTAEPTIGNQILDDAGFDIDPITGYRNAPDGNPFDITVEYSSADVLIAGGVAQIAADALIALDIDAQTQASDFSDFIS
ncbi:MAG: ABC transporter substrate-binding protein, partial [Candidatus Thorarchaeota archaeon]